MPAGETKFYDLLGVSSTASETELKKAYRKKVSRVESWPERRHRVSNPSEPVHSEDMNRSCYVTPPTAPCQLFSCFARMS